MSLLPPDRPHGLAVDAAADARGGRHRQELPRHEAHRRFPVGGIVGIVAAVLVVALGLVFGIRYYDAQQSHQAAVAAYQAALKPYQQAADDAKNADADLAAANDALTAANADATAILQRATDGYVGKSEKTALTKAVKQDVPARAAPSGTETPSPSPSASPTPVADGSAGDGSPVLPDDRIGSTSTDDLLAAAQALTAATTAMQTANAGTTAAITAAQTAATDLETKAEALLESADRLQRGWLADFIGGQDAPAAQHLATALGKLEAAIPAAATDAGTPAPTATGTSTAAAPDRAKLLHSAILWAGPVKPGALSSPSSIYVVVDKLHPVDDFDEQNPKSCDPKRCDWAPSDRVPVGTNGQVMRKIAATALTKLMHGASAAGYSVPALSCYRSYANQAATYNHWVAEAGGNTAQADTHSARPGYSEHQTGLVCDIGAGSQSWGTTAAGKWTAAHAAKYGFILRYDDGKQDESGYVYEPWHFRYVGVTLAKAIYAAGNPTLEEWMGLPAPKTYADGSGSPDVDTWNG